MATIEKVSIALSSTMLRLVRAAVETGDYASTSEVVREALRDWKARRAVEPAPSANPVYPLSPALRTELDVLCVHHGVRNLALFGSVLRPDFDPGRSDVDVTVEFDAPPSADAARQYFDLKAGLERIFGRPVDLVESTAMPESRLKRLIERSRVTVYERAEAA